VGQLLDIDLNTKDFFDRTPLLWAAKRGRKTIVGLILEEDDIDVGG
jgi:ankyrin repeat protein